jgi:hypothetical protein
VALREGLAEATAALKHRGSNPAHSSTPNSTGECVLRTVTACSLPRPAAGQHTPACEMCQGVRHCSSDLFGLKRECESSVGAEKGMRASCWAASRARVELLGLQSSPRRTFR